VLGGAFFFIAAAAAETCMAQKLEIFSAKLVMKMVINNIAYITEIATTS
jgi:hypothetical protein